MASPQQLKHDTTREGCSLPIPAWTEEEHRRDTASDPAGKQTQPLVSDDGLHVVVRKPVPVDGLYVVANKPVPEDGLHPVVPEPAPEDGLHVVSRESTAEPPPPPYETPATGRCVALPSRAAEWRVKSATDRDVRLSTLAAAVLVREGVLDGANVELLHDEKREAGDGGEEKSPRDPVHALKTSTFSVVSEIRRGASEASLRSYRKMRAAEEGRIGEAGRQSSVRTRPAGDDDGAESVSGASMSSTDVVESSRSSSREVRPAAVAKKKPNGAEKLDRFAAGAVSSGRGFARIMGVGLKAPGAYTHDLARGFNNVPRLYGDETVRADERIVGVGSGLAAAGKGLGYGLYDGITGIFVQPVKGAQKEGAEGFVKGFVKGVGGAVCKPAAGGLGVVGHTLVGIQKSIEKSISRRPSEEECIAAASVWQGEEEMRSLTDQEKTAIVNAWFAGSR